MKKILRHDNNIVKNQFHTYTPYTQSYGNNDEIRIVIQSQDVYVTPFNSYIYIEVEVANAQVVAPAVAPQLRFVHDFEAFLFSEIRYELNGIEVDRCRNPGITTNLKRYVAFPNTNMNKLVVCHEGGIATNRTYRLLMPLNTLFGFADDYRKILLNAKHELILVRSRSDSNAVAGDSENNNAVTFNIQKNHWKIQHVQLADRAMLTMLRFLEKRRTIKVPFRSWDLYEMPQLPQATKHIWSVKTATSMTKPRFVIVALQTNRNNNVRNTSSYFDHCNVSDVKLFLNNDCFPYADLNADFTNSNYQETYMALLQIQEAYYPFVFALDGFLTRPLFVFDCSRTDESILNSTVDVRIEINARTNIPANTTAFCLMIHDNVITYSPFNAIVNRDI